MPWIDISDEDSFGRIWIDEEVLLKTDWEKARLDALENIDPETGLPKTLYGFPVVVEDAVPKPILAPASQLKQEHQ